MSDTFEAWLQARLGQEDREPLLAHGVTSPDALLAVVRDPSAPESIRATACWAAGRLGDKRATFALLDAFGDPNPRVFTEAARSLGLLQSKRALRLLVAALTGDDDSERRWAAAYALSDLGDERAVDPLIRALTDGGEDVKVRAQAAESLGYLMDGRAVESLIATLRDPSPEVRFWSAFAHSWLRDRRALPELRRLAAEVATEIPEWWSISKEARDVIPVVEQGWEAE